MASYAVAADVKNACRVRNMAELVEESGSTVTGTGDARILAECEEQSSFIDGFLLGRTTTPVTTPTALMAVLRVHCIRLVMWGLFQDRLLSYPWVESDKNDTMSWLKRVADGDISLAGAPAPADTSDSGSISYDDRVFETGDGIL